MNSAAVDNTLISFYVMRNGNTSHQLNCLELKTIHTVMVLYIVAENHLKKKGKINKYKKIVLI